MKNRNCSPCTACCDGWLSSKNIKMSPGHPCAHCTDTGCAIYDTRPKPCKTFKCAWLKADSILPDNMRPDRCGAIVMTDRDYDNWKVILATPTSWAIPEVTLDWLKAYAKAQAMPLVYIENLHNNGVYTHFKRSGYGPLEFVRSIQSSAAPFESRDV